jgi:hypothetical protein
LFWVWVLFGLPALVIGYGMSGGDFELPDGLVETVVWLPVAFFVISPVILWPWRKSGPRRSG